MADASHSWWKLTFLRKKKSTPKTVYESVIEHAGTDKGPEENTEDSNYTARLEKIVDKNTKGKHVKVSNSGRFKERKKVRPSLNETPGLCPEPPQGQWSCCTAGSWTTFHEKQMGRSVQWPIQWFFWSFCTMYPYGMHNASSLSIAAVSVMKALRGKEPLGSIICLQTHTSVWFLTLPIMCKQPDTWTCTSLSGMFLTGALVSPPIQGAIKSQEVKWHMYVLEHATYTCLKLHTVCNMCPSKIYFYTGTSLIHCKCIY